MLDQCVGACFAKTYSKIADYYENELLDYRKADKVYRMGLDKLDSSSSSSDENDSTSNSKEARSLECLYQRFCDRMQRRVEKEAVEEIHKVRKS